MSCNNLKAQIRERNLNPVQSSLQSVNDISASSRNIQHRSKNIASKRLKALRKNIAESIKLNLAQSGKQHYQFNTAHTEDRDEGAVTSDKICFPTSSTSVKKRSCNLVQETNITKKRKLTKQTPSEDACRLEIEINELKSSSISENACLIKDTVTEVSTDDGISRIEDTAMEWDVTEGDTKNVDTDSLESNICIVTDTNIFLHYLHKIKDIMNFRDSENIKIYIPWMVIEELDYLKQNSKSDVKNGTIKAIDFINSNLEKRNPKIIGQTLEETLRQIHIGNGPDDKILASCLQIKQTYKHTILLSNDCNLRNKALLSNLDAWTPQNIMQKLLVKTKKNTKSSKIIHKLSILCTQIITDCCKETYGDEWNKMDMLENPPWSLLDCLKRITRYWKGVFKSVLLKQCLPKITALQSLLELNSSLIRDDSEAFNDFMKKVFELLIFFKDVPSIRTQVDGYIDEIILLTK